MLRVFHHYLSGRKLAFFVAESAAIAAGCVGGALVLSLALGARAFPSAWVTGIAFEAVALMAALQFALYSLDLYDLRIAGEVNQRSARLLRAGGLLALVTAGAALHWHLPPGVLLGGVVGASAGTLALRSVIGTWGEEPRRVVLIGNGLKARALAKAIQDQGDDSYQVVEMAELRRSGTEPVDGEASPVIALARRNKADLVVLALDEPRGGVRLDELVACRFAGIRVFEAGGFCERVLRRLPVAYLRASYLCFADELTLGAVRRLLKRAFDLFVASFMLAVTAPISLLVALAVKLESKGPLFYRQERVGEAGRTYQLWKFRSMRTDAEKDGAVWARVNDDRVTRVGRFIRKTRMDELPQLLNVLAGEMSFVGPRPERPVFVKQLKAQIPFYGLREVVKPGITGWAQIRYQYGASVEDARNKLEFDLYYVKNGSLFLDLNILFHTVRHVLLGRGAR